MRFQLWRRIAIRLRLKKWVAPAICAIPYFGSILWLLFFSQIWIALVMLVPALLMLVLGLLTFLLARLEFYGRLRRQ